MPLEKRQVKLRQPTHNNKSLAAFPGGMIFGFGARGTAPNCTTYTRLNAMSKMNLRCNIFGAHCNRTHVGGIA
eukprot:359079-Amphidinium_carterae.2